ncbi:MAG: ribosome-binding factor A [Candidatus Pacebacteria bacterium]|nr:ribosome-binding factor A [Candidatus Paceibacterota bacterium]MCF7862939.1 ribosome-binding factor A [Candidatus Paceibacterota bacterium]
MDQRNQKMANMIKEWSAQFLEQESNRTSLITVTNISLTSDSKKATIYISVLPTEKEHAALDFVKRKRKELREFIKNKIRTKIIPFIDIEIDQGEKNRQRIDELLRGK